VFEDLRRGGQTSLELRRSSNTGRPVVAFGAPIVVGGGFAGAVSCGLETTRISQAIDELQTAGSRKVYLVDAAGQAIASMGDVVPAFTDLADQPPVQTLREARGPGAIRFGPPERELVAGYAPIAELGWGVVVERSIADDLASVRGARELAFGLLILAISLAALAGILVANFFIAPLNALASAVARFAAGDAAAPLPHQSVSEVARVSAAFDQMRRELMAAAAAREDAISQRDSFFSVAAHELKTPLTALLGQAQLLQRRVRREGALDERSRRSIDVVVAQAERLSLLVSDLLDISRLQQGRLTLAQDQVDLGALVGRVADEVRPTVERQSISYGAPAGAPLIIDGDPIRLEQVLHNLISNALKYSRDGDEVVVQVERDGPWARVRVSDRGIGIPAEALPHLFERFYRAPNATSQQIGGMGVGLFVVREIVAMHGGSVEAQSAEGEGSVFTVTLPLAER
jgi:signal transduction histidine kinase